MNYLKYPLLVLKFKLNLLIMDINIGNKADKIIIKLDDDVISFKCPHCKDLTHLFVKDLKCKIFIHAWNKITMKQVNPHTKKKDCEKLIKKNKIIGCGKPFELIICEDGYIAKTCDYE